MRLAQFILSNVEPILAGWEIFARSLGAGRHLDQLTLRDHAAEILAATALVLCQPLILGFVIPAQAGIQHWALDPRLRGNDTQPQF